MAYWLLKSEPGAFGWDDQVALGPKGGQWDGVRNYQARNNMKAMKVGDLGFFYHSVDEKRIVGVVEDVTEHLKLEEAERAVDEARGGTTRARSQRGR